MDRERFPPFPATDDRGVRYQVSWMIGPAAMDMPLRPDPRHQIRWLDLITEAGQPATRVHLDRQVPVPDVTVTRDAHSPGELLLDAIAARILLTAVPSPEQLAADAELRSFIGAGPGHIVAALDGAGLLPPDSPLPGPDHDRGPAPRRGAAPSCTCWSAASHSITNGRTTGAPGRC